MSLIKPWVSALRVDPSQFQLWQTQKPNNSSMTFWCLETHKVKLLDYLQWARDHFGLAVIKEAYFEEPPQLEFWHKIKSVANWSPELLPLAEWDGVVFVGCVEPPEDIQWSFPVRYLLASPKSLLGRWQQLQKGVMTSVAPAVAKAPMPPPSIPPEVSTPVLNPSLSPEMAPLSVPATETNGFDALERGLDAAAEESESPSPSTNSALVVMPEGLSLDSLSVAPLKLSEEAEPITGVTGVNTGSGYTDPLSKPISSAPSAPAPQGSVIDTHRIAPNDLASAKTVNEAVAWAFDRMRTHFHHSMVLIFEGPNLRPWRWETAWVPRSNENFKAFDLEQPSLFRIVQRTRLPYHGHVVPSEANVRFFLNWGHESLPAHVTAVPLILNGEMLGLLMSIGEASANSSETLDFCERTAMPLAQSLVKFQVKAA